MIYKFVDIFWSYVLQIPISKMVKLSLYELGQSLGFPGGYRFQFNRHGRSTAGRIKSMKNSNDPIGYRILDLPACSASPQPTAPPRVPIAVTTLSLPESKVFIFHYRLLIRCLCFKHFNRLAPWTACRIFRRVKFANTVCWCCLDLLCSCCGAR